MIHVAIHLGIPLLLNDRVRSYFFFKWKLGSFSCVVLSIANNHILTIYMFVYILEHVHYLALITQKTLLKANLFEVGYNI